VRATEYKGDRSASNYDFVDAVGSQQVDRIAGCFDMGHSSIARAEMVHMDLGFAREPTRAWSVCASLFRLLPLFSLLVRNTPLASVVGGRRLTSLSSVDKGRAYPAQSEALSQTTLDAR
jgi:hypothetical protein